MLDHGLMTEKLARRGLHVPLDYDARLPRPRRVRDAMTTDVERARRRRPSPTRAAASTARLAQRVPARRRATGAASASSPGATCSRPTPTDDTPLLDIASHRRRHPRARRHAADRARTHRRRRGRAPPRASTRTRRIVGMCTRTDILRARSQSSRRRTAPDPAGTRPAGGGARRASWSRPARVEAEPPGRGPGLAPILTPSLAEDVRHVDACGLHRDEERVGDLAVGTALGDEGDDVELAGGQAVAGRRATRPCRSRPRSRRARRARLAIASRRHVQPIVLVACTRRTAGAARRGRPRAGRPRPPGSARADHRRETAARSD